MNATIERPAPVLFKIAVLLHRREGLPVEEFQRKWLTSRAARLLERRQFRRYVQSHPLPQSYRRDQPHCDGLEEFWFDDAALAKRFQSELAHIDTATDGGLLRDAQVMLVGERLVSSGAADSQSIKSVILVQRKTGMSREAFLSYWQGNHAQVAGRLPGMQRYEQNPVDDTTQAGPPRDIDGLSLAWFASLDVLKVITRSPAYELALEDETRFLEQGGHLPIVLTREHVLIDDLLQK